MGELLLIALTNDMKALGMARFNFAMSKLKTTSERKSSSISKANRTGWEVKTRGITEIRAIPVGNPGFLTISERLQSLPKEFSPKIESIPICTFQPEGTDELYYLKWERDTIHKSASTETDYQNWLLSRMEKVWCEILDVKSDLKWTPSILVLRNARSSKNPDVELAHNEDFLYRVLLPYLYDQDNPLTGRIYRVVERREVKRGLWEYRPHKKED